LELVKIAFVINPKSGRSKRDNIEVIIRQNLDFEKYLPVFYYTQYSKHAYELVYKCVSDGCTIVVAVGGDGTVNEVGAAAAELNIILGIIPTGSGNGLARHLEISTTLIKAVKNLNTGNVFTMDAGKINETWFFCTCGVGFDARIGHKFSKVKKRGLWSYITTTIKEFRKYRPRKYRFWIDDKKYIRRAFLITIANAGQYGNNAYIAPNASIDDGLFDVGILKPFPVIKALILGFRLFNRSIENSRYHEVIRAKEITFKKRKKKYIFHYDGEPKKYSKQKIYIRIYPQQLKVIAPLNQANQESKSLSYN
jgi:diacylglycerol kinase (ATP)